MMGNTKLCNINRNIFPSVKFLMNSFKWNFLRFRFYFFFLIYLGDDGDEDDNIGENDNGNKRLSRESEGILILFIFSNKASQRSSFIFSFKWFLSMQERLELLRQPLLKHNYHGNVTTKMMQKVEQ